MAGFITSPGSEPSGSIWGHILDSMTGGLFGKNRKEDPTEYHNRRTEEEMPEGDGKGTGDKPQADQKTSMLHNNRASEGSVTHPQLKNIMAKLNEKDDDSPLGGGKGRYMGMRKKA